MLANINHSMLVNVIHNDASIIRSVEKYRNHSSIIAIKSKNINKHLAFNGISKSRIGKEILNLYFSEPF